MISLIFFLIGTFGRIFHGILVDEKDPNKEKQVFVKTVKGKIFFSHTIFIMLSCLSSSCQQNLPQILSVCQTFK